MHHSDQLYVFRSTRLFYPSPLIVFSKCQEQTDRRRRHTSHLATMRPNAKHRENAMHGHSFLSLRYFLDQIPKPWNISQGFFLFDIVMHFLPRRPPWWSSNYTGLQNGKSNRGRAPLHPSVSYHITLWYYCGLRPQAESSTVINLVGFDSMEWE